MFFIQNEESNLRQRGTFFLLLLILRKVNTFQERTRNNRIVRYLETEMDTVLVCWAHVVPKKTDEPFSILTAHYFPLFLSPH